MTDTINPNIHHYISSARAMLEHALSLFNDDSFTGCGAQLALARQYVAIIAEDQRKQRAAMLAKG